MERALEERVVDFEEQVRTFYKETECRNAIAAVNAEALTITSSNLCPPC